jgi:outer membrane protein OmpA-like peptidoglycan-associated protein
MAQSVADELRERGVPGSLIVQQGLGETQLAQGTADGVREPLNRRVEVTLTFRQS